MNFLINYPDYDVDNLGNVYKNGQIIKPFNSNGYFQVLLFDRNHKRKVCGVHTLVATKYISSFYEGCVVHHINHDKHDNRVENLEVLSRKEHSARHPEHHMYLVNYIKIYGPWNKGKIMNDEYREKCRISALKRNNKIIHPIKFNDPNIKCGRFD